MPYINEQAREELDGYIAALTTALRAAGVHPGYLNYIITKLCLGYMSPKPDYFQFNEVIGVLECAKLELYRRAVVPYEDKKCMEQGDVY